MTSRRVLAGLAALTLVLGLGGAAAAGPLDAVAGCALDGYDDRCEAWTSIEDDPDGLAPSQFPKSIAASPDGQRVYAAIMETAGSGFDSKARWAVVARSASTGAALWSWRAAGAPQAYAFPATLAVSPDGARIFVSGSTRGSYLDPDGRLTTTALDSATGAPMWTSTYDGPGNGTDNARTMLVSPDGEEVYVVAISGPGGNLDYAAIAYDAATGEERWVARYAGIGTGKDDSPFDAALAGGGQALVLTGWSAGHGEFDLDFGTVAFRTRGPEAGSVLWEARYDGVGARAPDRANAIAVSPDGGRVFVGGMSGEDRDGPPFSVDYRFTVVAYDSATGAQLWEARRTWEGATLAEVLDLAAAPDGSAVYATGLASGSGNSDMVVRALDAASGAERWAVRDGQPEHDSERGLAIAAAPGAVIVSGNSSTRLTEPLFLNQRRLVDHVTASFAPANGARVWTARLNATGLGQTSASALALAGGRVLVLGQDSDNVAADPDTFDTILAAYPAS